MISFPWDNKSEMERDRSISNDILTNYFYKINGYKSGIFEPLSSKGIVTVQGGLSLSIAAVDGAIQGTLFEENVSTTKILENADTKDRIDLVVIRKNKATRETYINIIKGTPADNPIVPALVRFGDIYDVGLSYVLVPALSSELVQQNVTDVRLNSEYCDLLPTINNVDTSSIFLQYQTALEAFLSESDELIEELKQAIIDAGSGGIVDKAVTFPKLADDVIANNIINEYTQSNSALNGVGRNGTFKATSNITAQVLLVNGVSYSVKVGEETEIELIADVYYSFILDEVAKTINFKTGGAGLDIKVVGGTTRPTSPKENTIWVNTNLDLNFKAFKIGYDYPTTPQVNDVFIFISDNDLVYSYADKNKQIKIGLLNVYYYDGSKWVLLIFETYADNQWHSATILYYNYGLTTFPFSFGGGAFDGGTYLGVRKIQSQSAFSAAVAYTSSKVDVTKLKTLNITVQFIQWTTVAKNYDFMTLGLVSTIGSTFDYNNPVFAKQVVSRQESTRVYSIDVSAMSGSYHICAKALGYAGTTHFNVTKIEGVI